MLTDDAASFAKSALDLQVIGLRQLLDGVAAWAASDTQQSLREVLVAAGHMSEADGLAVARAVAKKSPADRLRGGEYDLGSILGKGANGVVHLCGDRHLGRDVAIKLHPLGSNISEIELLRFTHEAQVTGQLAHPGIVPVHDLGVLPDGRPYYTMKKVEGRTLKDVLSRLKKNDPELSARWTPAHMVSVLLRIAEALAFAHDRGVIHRDVKPANIMVAAYGEVLLMDWGVARVLGDATGGQTAVTTWRSTTDDDLTIDGTVAGTPAYMAPEQAKGDIAAISGASDVYSVGVILYEYLCGTRPFKAGNIQELLERVVRDPIVSPSKRGTRVDLPADLEELCLRCLEKDPARRFPDGAALARALEDFLEGTRQLEEARSLTQRGRDKAESYLEAAAAARFSEDNLRALRESLAPWASREQRRVLWAQERDWQGLRSRRDDLYDEAVALLQTALKYAPDHQDAKDGLARLFHHRMEECEARGESQTARFFRAQVLRYDSGSLRSQLEGEFRLALATDPPGAEVVIRPLEEVDRVLAPSDRAVSGPSPLDEITLTPGTYAIEVGLPGFVPTTFALRADRPGGSSHRLKLRPESELQAGFLLIPTGPFLAGGDPLALDAPPKRTIDLPDFAISAHPVTHGQLREWLAEEPDPNFGLWDGGNLVDRGEVDSLPALGVPFPMAQAFIAWKSRTSNCSYRLPTHDEWEKAARGVDGRLFPWGNGWEATHCNSPLALEGDPRPCPVGSYPQDRSIYGVQDLAGGVQEWVSGSVPHRPDHAWLRGGSWNSHPREARICSRISARKVSRGRTIGFRLVQELAAQSG
ncbi:MAG TPA: hypothetical protein DIU15_06240 [Deltaproteobacteria bacterium]|nr:hypothetical protein [Deltaproteobacteria bacterium]HCP45619.1 hypothetical protein [Deltaproteobacteria bacterium]